MFEEPKIAPPETPYIDVRITKVHYYPLATLRARLLELMLPGNTWQTTAAAPPETITETVTVQPNIDQTTMVQVQPTMDQVAMAPLAMDMLATEQSGVNQDAGRKRKFENEHHDQPSQRWAPSVYLTPVS